MRLKGKKKIGETVIVIAQILFAAFWAASFVWLKAAGIIPRTFVGEFLLYVPVLAYPLIVVAIWVAKNRHNNL